MVPRGLRGRMGSAAVALGLAPRILALRPLAPTWLTGGPFLFFLSSLHPSFLSHSHSSPSRSAASASSILPSLSATTSPSPTMDNLVSIYHGGTIERDRYGYVEFVGMQSVPVLFDEKSSFSELVARSRGRYIAIEMMALQLWVYFVDGP